MRVLKTAKIENSHNSKNNYFIGKKKKNTLGEVEDKLKGWGVEYEIKNLNHIRIGRVNYYPSTGTCYIDMEDTSISKKGLNILKEILLREKLI
jgi:hypothetical protein